MKYICCVCSSEFIYNYATAGYGIAACDFCVYCKKPLVCYACGSNPHNKRRICVFVHEREHVTSVDLV